MLSLIIQVFRAKTEVKFFWMEHKPSKALSDLNIKYEKLDEQYKQLDAHSKFKSQVMRLLVQTFMTHSNWAGDEDNNFEGNVKNLYDFVLPGILSLLTKDRNNTLRISILTPRIDGLRILHGYGYSDNGKRNLCLSFSNSKAGHTYTNNEPYSTGDLSKDPTFKRHPDASKDYYSLVCVPIEFAGEVLGVLNVDAEEKHSFDKDDIDYIDYFATALAPSLNQELVYYLQQEREEIGEGLT